MLDTVFYYPDFATISGSALAGLLLSYCLDHNNTLKQSGNMWFTLAALQDTTLNFEEFTAALSVLVELGFIEHVPGDLYRVNEAAIIRAVAPLFDRFRTGEG